ncbi:arylamine N-acetyltransferase [Paenibacillus filicis]|uniref:Arylamine N-acetyltransferase n=1 Tax=Paenibacillus filicis TaxID=669464 RepID=A0ABU9DI63_9BACL
MTDNQLDVKPEVRTYLDRIGYDGPCDNSLRTLELLQECHLHAVPYENLDIIHGIPLSLEIPKLYDKIVARRRGGYCFELNALFSWLLTELGFKVTSLFARFWRDVPESPPMRRHQILLVEAEGSLYVCDVGVGSVVPRWPIRLEERLEHVQGTETYQLERDADFGWVLCESKNGEWRWIYSFTEEPQLPIDYIMASYWSEHAPESVFTKQAIVAIRTKEGRNSMLGQELRVFTDEGVQVLTLASPEECSDAWRTYFGIVIS